MPRVVITVPGKNAQPYRFQLDQMLVTLGRGSDNDIAIDSGSVSVQHAHMHRVEGGYELRDVNSTNGIKLHDEQHAVVPLHNGISLTLGDVAFDFSLSEDELEVLGREHAAAQPDKPEVAAAPERAPAAPSQRPLLPRAAEMDRTTLVLIIILAVGAFGAGMALRFQKDTGRSLLDAMRTKGQVVQPAAPAPATDDESAPDAAPRGSALDVAAPDGASPDTATPDATTPDTTTPDANGTPDAAPETSGQ